MNKAHQRHLILWKEKKKSWERKEKATAHPECAQDESNIDDGDCDDKDDDDDVDGDGNDHDAGAHTRLKNSAL